MVFQLAQSSVGSGHACYEKIYFHKEWVHREEEKTRSGLPYARMRCGQNIARFAYI